MNCGIIAVVSYGHNIEHNRQLYEHCMLKSIIGTNWNIIGWSLGTACILDQHVIA